MLMFVLLIQGILDLIGNDYVDIDRDTNRKENIERNFIVTEIQ